VAEWVASAGRTAILNGVINTAACLRLRPAFAKLKPVRLVGCNLLLTVSPSRPVPLRQFFVSAALCRPAARPLRHRPSSVLGQACTLAASRTGARRQLLTIAHNRPDPPANLTFSPANGRPPAPASSSVRQVLPPPECISSVARRWCAAYPKPLPRCVPPLPRCPLPSPAHDWSQPSHLPAPSHVQKRRKRSRISPPSPLPNSLIPTMDTKDAFMAVGATTPPPSEPRSASAGASALSSAHPSFRR
jgi:hypothetical protein